MLKVCELCVLCCVLACVCVFTAQWCHVRMLRMEVEELSRRMSVMCGEEEEEEEEERKDEASCCYSATSCRSLHVGLESSRVRVKRHVSLQEKKRQKRQTEKSTFVHLIPASKQSDDDRDLTVLTWALGRSQGAGLQVSGETITVVTEGHYFIYSQVLYKDPTWVMGHVITKRLKGAEFKLMKCLKSMPSNVSVPVNTCYTAGIHFLESGSVLELSIPRKSADIILLAHATFFGIFSI